MRVGLAAAAIVILVVTGCGGGSDDNEPSAASSAPEPSTQAATTTPPPTDPPPTTAPPAPTTTIDPTESLIADIEADLNAGEQAALAGSRSPADRVSRDTLSRFFSGAALEFLLGFYDQLVAEGLFARANPEVPSIIRVSEVVDASDDQATVIFCRIDAGVIAELLPDGSEAVVDDEVVRTEVRLRVVLVDGVWTNPGGGELLDESTGVMTCG